MLFSQVAGQRIAKTGLLQLWKGNRLPHALLFVGAEGTGGLPLAFALAQYALCTNKRDEDSCGQCANCRKVSRLEHADLHLTFPAISPKPNTKALSRFFMQEFREFVTQTPYGSTFDWLQFINAENKQGNIPAEECREIIDSLNLKSYEGGKKIQIIWRAEYLGKEGNILLKLIEEPPAETLLILVAENLEGILPTILSRTQIVRLVPLSPADLAQALSERSLADSKKAAQIAHLSNGSFTEALRLVRDTDNDLYPAVRRWFNAMFTGDGIEVSKLADEWSKLGREQQKSILHYTIQLLEQSVRVRFMAHTLPTLPQEEAEFVRRLAAMQLKPTIINEMVNYISKCIYHIERNVHGKTALHVLSLKIIYAIKGQCLQVM
ncbi:MAG: hypothetical protein JSS78_03155 [Bacteroidetes bacterium]|nr:hypothetical protein [Bacteroidota bacterium]